MLYKDTKAKICKKGSLLGAKASFNTSSGYQENKTFKSIYKENNTF